MKRLGKIAARLFRRGKFAFLLLPVVCLLWAVFTSCSVEITAARYALVYGAADYAGAGNDLGSPDDDARDMASALQAAGWTVAASELDGTVTRDQVLDGIAALGGTVDPDSSVLVYFSGHGTVDADGNACIVPTDENHISAPELLSALDALPCRNRVVILDTCYSGGFVSATDTGTLDSAPQNYGEGEYDDGTGTLPLFAALRNYASLLGDAFDTSYASRPIVVTAAGAQEFSWESLTTKVLDPDYPLSEGNGVFTYYFLQAASYGDSNGDGHVTIQEAYRYARNMFDKYWNAYIQDPDFYDAYYPDYYDDFLPRISGNARDIVIF